MKVAIEICEEFAEHWEQQARSGDNTGASDHRADAARQIIAELRNVHTAPPAQTALTDDARDAARYRWIRDGEKDVFCVIGSNGPWGECGHQEIYDERLDDRIDAALTAAQSASASEGK
jgi:hypothetical protein